MNSMNISDLALHHGAIQKTSELMALIDFLRPLPLETIVEIGTRKGGTLVMWLLISRADAWITSIDLPHGPFAGGDYVKDVELAAQFRRPAQRVHLIRGDSHAIETRVELVKFLQGRAIDLLFIDGDHAYDGVKQDYEMYAPLVKSGGLVVFHDIIAHPGFPACQVDRFWRELKSGREFREFVDSGHDVGYGPWGGIGIVREA